MTTSRGASTIPAWSTGPFRVAAGIGPLARAARQSAMALLLPAMILLPLLTLAG